LVEAQLLALVDVRRAGQGEQQQDRGPRTPLAEGEVAVYAELSIVQREPRVGATIAGDVTHHVVIGQYPGRRCTYGGVQGDAVIDHFAHGRRVPRAAQEVEVERGVQLVRAKVEREPFGRVGQPHLTDERSRLLVAVGDASPGPVDLVDLIAVGERVRHRG